MADEAEKDPLEFRRKFKAEIKEVENQEQRMVGGEAPIEKNVWQIYEGDTVAYDMSFSDLLKSFGLKSFSEWMERRKQSGQTTHVLDVMGGNGAFLRDLGRYGERGQQVNPAFDKSLVVTLADERPTWDQWVEEDAKRRVSILAGDITSGKTWADVDEWMDKEGVPAFDLVVCRGVEGVDLIPVALYPALLERFYSRTSSKQGLIMTQVTDEVRDEQVQSWNDTLSRIPGIRSSFQPERAKSPYIYHFAAGAAFPAIGIEKSEQAPVTLREAIRTI